MEKISLKTRIENYLRKRSDFVASGDIQRLAQENGYYSPQNAGRRLRELAEEGKLEVEYRRGHAWYRHRNGGYVEPPKRRVVVMDGRALLVN